MNNNTIERINIMEVCGTHTVAIARHGLKQLFPAEVKMLSGPGCPICVTTTADIDRAIAIAKLKNVIIATFGDMIHVPGSYSSLEKERSSGGDIRIVYSPVDSLNIARENPSKQVVFLGVGFETTSPAIAATVIIAKKKKIKNFFVLPMFKTIPNALRAIIEAGMNSADKMHLHAFILPGHVSTIIGSKVYEFISKEFGIPGVISGFEPKDILDSVDMILAQIRDKKPRIEIQYTRSVRPDGNKTARATLKRVFQETDSDWRAIGIIPKSGLVFNSLYKDFDAGIKFPVKVLSKKDPKGCSCGEILLGNVTPLDCTLFGTSCTPSSPIGPCMVSSEGACAAEYKYGNRHKRVPNS